MKSLFTNEVDAVDCQKNPIWNKEISINLRRSIVLYVFSEGKKKKNPVSEVVVLKTISEINFAPMTMKIKKLSQDNNCFIFYRNFSKGIWKF